MAGAPRGACRPARTCLSPAKAFRADARPCMMEPSQTHHSERPAIKSASLKPSHAVVVWRGVCVNSAKGGSAYSHVSQGFVSSIRLSAAVAGPMARACRLRPKRYERRCTARAGPWLVSRATAASLSATAGGPFVALGGRFAADMHGRSRAQPASVSFQDATSPLTRSAEFPATPGDEHATQPFGIGKAARSKGDLNAARIACTPDFWCRVSPGP
jgi:hypothetical protein